MIFEKNAALDKNAIGLGNNTDAQTGGIVEKEQINYGEDFSMNVEEGYKTQSSFLCSGSRNILKKLSLRNRHRTNHFNSVDEVKSLTKKVQKKLVLK